MIYYSGVSSDNFLFLKFPCREIKCVFEMQCRIVMKLSFRIIRGIENPTKKGWAETIQRYERSSLFQNIVQYLLDKRIEKEDLFLCLCDV